MGAVRACGVCVTSLDALGLEGSQAMLTAAAELDFKYRRMRRGGELDGTDGFQADAADILARRAIFDWGLNDRLLDIVEAYLGQPVAYDGLNLFYTKADGREVAARKWHRDVEDRRVLKIAVYVNDVDEEGGPLEILRIPVPGADSDGAPNYPVFTQEKLESRIGRRLDRDAVTTCVGRAGTVIFAETGLRFHRGKPATSRDRCAIFYNYFTRPPLRPFFCERSTLSRKQLDELAAPLGQRQRDCVNWRRSVHPLLRLIPSAPI